MSSTSFVAVNEETKRTLREFLAENPEILEHILHDCGTVSFRMGKNPRMEYLVAQVDEDASWHEDTGFGYWERVNTHVIIEGWSCGWKAIVHAYENGEIIDERLKGLAGMIAEFLQSTQKPSKGLPDFGQLFQAIMRRLSNLSKQPPDDANESESDSPRIVVRGFIFFPGERREDDGLFDELATEIPETPPWPRNVDDGDE